jgi:hypothetical protein
MSKTFKKSSKVADDYENNGHYFKYQKSRQDRQSFRSIDKYIKTQDFDRLDDLSEYDYNNYK